MIIRYDSNFYANGGTRTHIVRVYRTYTDANGLEDLIEEREVRHARKALVGLKITPVQRRKITALMKDRESGIILVNVVRLQDSDLHRRAATFG